MNMADGEGKHKCLQCGKSYTKNWRLVEHIRSHTGERPYKCDFEGCGKSFIRPFHLRRHLLVHTGTASFKCSYPGCNQTFMLKHNLNRHERRSHNLPFKCDFEGCSESFRKKSQLRKHVCSHTNEKPFRCEVEGCDWGFMSLPRLERHMKKHTKGYLCSKPGCAEAFDTFSKLNAHIRSHGFVCEHCKKVFGAVYQLRMHLLIHATDRPRYECPNEGCSKSYSTVGNLNKHIKTVHEGQRSYVCTVEGCGKAYAHKRNLAHHQDLHAQGKWRPEAATRRKKKIKKKKKPASLAKLISGYHSSHSESSETFSLGSGPEKRKASSDHQKSEAERVKSKTLQSIAAAGSDDQENDISMKSTADGEPMERTDSMDSDVHQNAAPVSCELQAFGPSDASGLGSNSVECERAQSMAAQKTGAISGDSQENSYATSNGRRVLREPQADIRGANVSSTTRSSGEHIEPTLPHSTFTLDSPKNGGADCGSNASNTSQQNVDDDGQLPSDEDTEAMDWKWASPMHSDTESMLEAMDEHLGGEHAREGSANQCNSITDNEPSSITSRTESRSSALSSKRQTPPEGRTNDQTQSPTKEFNRSITVPDPRSIVGVDTNKSIEVASPLQSQALTKNVKANDRREDCSTCKGNDFPGVDDPLQVIIEGKDLENEPAETIIQGNESSLDGRSSEDCSWATHESTCSTEGRPVNDKEEKRNGVLEIRPQSDENEHAAENRCELSLQEDDNNLAEMSGEISPCEFSGRRQESAFNSYQEGISDSEPIGVLPIESCYKEMKSRCDQREWDISGAIDAKCSEYAKISDVNDSDEEDIAVSESDRALSLETSAKRMSSHSGDHSATLAESTSKADLQCVGNANNIVEFQRCEASLGNCSRDTSPREKALLQSPIDDGSGCVLSSHKRKSRNAPRRTVRRTSGSERVKDFGHINKRSINNDNIKRRGVEKSFEIQSVENHCTFSQSGRNVAESSDARGLDVSKAKLRRKARNFLPCDLQALELLWNFTGE